MSSKKQDAHRKRIRNADAVARLHHTDAHAAHLAVLGAANTDEEHEQAAGLLKHASPSLIGALDTLLELYGEEMPADLRQAIHHYLNSGSVVSARKWLSTTGYGLAHHVARQHLMSWGGSVAGWHKFLHVISTPFRWMKDAVEGASSVAGHVAQNLAPVAEAAAPIIAAAGQAAAKAGPAAAMIA
jgi:hypothetical protein